MWLAAAVAVLLAAVGGSVGVHAGGVRGQRHHHQQQQLLTHNKEDAFSSFKQLKAVVGAIEGTVLQESLIEVTKAFRKQKCHVAKAKPGVLGAIKKEIADLKGKKAAPAAGEVGVGAAQKLTMLGAKEGLRAGGAAEVAASMGAVTAGLGVASQIAMHAKKEWLSSFSILNFETWLLKEAHRIQLRDVAKEVPRGTALSVDGMMNVLAQQGHPVKTEYPNVMLVHRVSFANKHAEAAAILDAFASSSAWLDKWVAEVTGLAIAFEARFGRLDRAESSQTSSNVADLAKTGLSSTATVAAATPSLVRAVQGVMNPVNSVTSAVRGVQGVMNSVIN